MAYIGSTPASGDFVLLDNLTASATASYTMQRNSVNFSPQSANHMIVSLNGTIQKPGSSFTISGSTITFASALTSSDAIDFILVLGNVNDVGVATSVVDSAITKNKTDFITDGSSAGVTVKGSGSDSGSIALNCSSNSHAIELISPDHSAGQSYKLKFPDNNVTADKFIKVKSITGSGATATGQLEFADAGGGLVFLGGTTFSSNVADIDLDHFSSDYMIHKVYGTISGDTAGQDYYLQWRNGGSDQTSNVYITSIATNLQSSGSTTNTTDYGGWGLTYMPFVSGSITSDTTPARFEMTVYNAMSTAYNPAISFKSMYYRTGNQWAVATGTMYFSDGGGNSMEGIRLYPSANNFDKGEVRVYGVVNS